VLRNGTAGREKEMLYRKVLFFQQMKAFGFKNRTPHITVIKTKDISRVICCPDQSQVKLQKVKLDNTP
jgi:hypothetical protein